MDSVQNTFMLSNGVKIPCVGYGTWRMKDGESSVEAISEALRCGYRHIDTAYVYGNEQSVGKAIKASGIDRKELFITTKLWNDFRGYEGTIKAFEASLNNLGLDYVDLYLIHWPVPVKFKDNWEQMNAESWRAMEQLYRDGKIRAIGVSNFLPHHLDALLKTAEIIPTVNQIEVHVGCFNEEVIEYCKSNGILVEAWAPFAVGGVLDLPVMKAAAERYSKTPAQIALKWLLTEGILPLPKSVTPSRIAENANLFDFELTEDECLEMKQADGPRSTNDPDNIDF